MSRARREISPALMGSVALHVAVAAALLISWRFERNLKLGSAVPVTLVASAPSQLEAPVQAPEPAPAQAETSTPQAPPVPVPPAPRPAPEPQPAPPKPAPPPKPTPAPKPAPTPKPAPKVEKPVEQTPPPKAKTAAKPEKSLDLDALAASLSKMSKPAGGKPGQAARGAPRAAAAPTVGKELSKGGQAALNGLIEDLEKHWHPNCNVEGARDVQVRIRFRIDPEGQVQGDPKRLITDTPSTVVGAATVRAAQTILAGEPYRNLPPELYGQTITAIFNGKDACP